MINLKYFRYFYRLTQKQLASRLGIEETTIKKYESGQTIPTLKILLRISQIFFISLDYLFLEEECPYTKNLEFLNLAQKFDHFDDSEHRGFIEKNIKTILDNTIDQSIEIKQDLPDLQLTDSFYKNLKAMRNKAELTQPQLAEKIGISRSLLAQYELKSYPPPDKLKKISEALNISIHALTTGKPLFFDFQDRHFGKIIFLADRFLPLEDQEVIVKIMTKIIEKS